MRISKDDSLFDGLARKDRKKFIEKINSAGEIDLDDPLFKGMRKGKRKKFLERIEEEAREASRPRAWRDADGKTSRLSNIEGIAWSIGEQGYRMVVLINGEVARIESAEMRHDHNGHLQTLTLDGTCADALDMDKYPLVSSSCGKYIAPGIISCLTGSDCARFEFRIVLDTRYRV